MRIAVNDAIAVERPVPGAEQTFGVGLPFHHRRVFFQPLGQRRAFQPGHGQQPFGAIPIDRPRHQDARLIAEHKAVKPLMRGLPQVVQLLAQPVAEFLEDL